MIILGIDPGPGRHGAVLYDSDARRVLWSDKAAATYDLCWPDHAPMHRVVSVWPNVVLIERPSVMGPIGPAVVGPLLETAWEAGRLEKAWSSACVQVETMTRREVLRHLGAASGTGSADSRVRAACIEDHGGSRATAIGRKAAPGPLYGVSSHSWQALGLVLAWLERTRTQAEKAEGAE